MQAITYTGETEIEMPTLGLAWHPGDTHDLPDDLAAELDGDERAPFAGSRKKAAREARATAAAASAAEVAALQAQIASVETHAEQPAEAVQNEGVV